MRVRFLGDANLDRRIIEGVCRHEPALDFQTASQAGLSGKSNLDVLEIAAIDNRILVAHDLQTMPAAFAR